MTATGLRKLGHDRGSSPSAIGYYRWRILLRIRTEKLPLGNKVGLAHLELRRTDLAHAVAAKAHQVVRRRPCRDGAEFADQARPVRAGFENVVDWRPALL
jgi:hypothetical protein